MTFPIPECCSLGRANGRMEQALLSYNDQGQERRHNALPCGRHPIEHNFMARKCPQVFATVAAIITSKKVAGHVYALADITTNRRISI